MKSVEKNLSSIQEEIRYHGNHNTNNNQVNLKAGQLSMVYENGNLRYISLRGKELIRMIYSAVRIQGWVTVAPIITEERIEKYKDTFLITYFCSYKMGEVDFHAVCRIEGKNDSSVIFSFDGEALTTFMKNRIGLCLLHPLEECCGKDCIITHQNGETETSKFPVFITPVQPFLDIKKMFWNVSQINCSLVFTGDIFETEDQRNWTDASFKTYSTPLSQTYPVTLIKGEKISQSIKFKIKNDQKSQDILSEIISLNLLPDQIRYLPFIGIGRSTRPNPLTANEIHLLRDLNFDHYRIDLYLFEKNWKKTAEEFIFEAAELNYSVEFALFLDDAINQINDFICWLTKFKINISLFTLYHKTIQSCPDEITDTIAKKLKEAHPLIKVCSGTNANFAQLNRNRPKSIHNDYICYSIQPQEHASDNSSLIENLLAQAHTVESASSFARGKGIWISPVNIQRRFNANIENFEKVRSSNEFPLQTDSRLMSLFGACWTTGSLKYLIESGVSGVTYYETAGERGIIQGDFDSIWPNEFPSFKGMLFPLFHVFRFILKNKNYHNIKSISSQPLKVEILTLSDGQNLKVILTNFTGSTQKIKTGFNWHKIRIFQINSFTYLKVVTDKKWIENTSKQELSTDEIILLDPFSISFIEGRS
jgi:D-apionolactonase